MPKYKYEIQCQSRENGLWYVIEQQIETYYKEEIQQRGLFVKKPVLVKVAKTEAELRVEARLLAEQTMQAINANPIYKNVRIAKLKVQHYSDAPSEYFFVEAIWKNGRWL